MDYPFLFLICLFVVGFVYASVGHGGASGYLATMALFGVAPLLLKPSALLLNLFVSTVSFWQFYRAGYFRWDKFWPFAVASVPLAFVGAKIPLSDTLYRQLLAGCLLLVVIRLVWTVRGREEEPKPVPLGAGLFTGGIIGLLSGMIGIGGFPGKLRRRRIWRRPGTAQRPNHCSSLDNPHRRIWNITPHFAKRPTTCWRNCARSSRCSTGARYISRMDGGT